MPFEQIGHSTPFNHINGSVVNIDNSHYSGSGFNSRVLPQSVNYHILPEPLNSQEAVNSYIPGCTTGGSINKKKFKKISNKYKMPKRKLTLSKLKRKLYGKSKNRKSKKITRKNKVRKSQKGGYSQYQNNMPMTQTYSLGGFLSPYNSALASPAPQNVLSNCTNCVDNYSHYTNKGFSSKNSY